MTLMKLRAGELALQHNQLEQAEQLLLSANEPAAAARLHLHSGDW